MGCFGSKQKISKVDLEYLKKHTRYDEATIKEWFKGFRVSLYLFLHLSLSLSFLHAYTLIANSRQPLFFIPSCAFPTYYRRCRQLGASRFPRALRI